MKRKKSGEEPSTKKASVFLITMYVIFKVIEMRYKLAESNTKHCSNNSNNAEDFF